MANFRQRSSISGMIFGVPFLYRTSAVITLIPGEVIKPGTPQGLGWE